MKKKKFLKQTIKANREIYKYICTKFSLNDLDYAGNIGDGGDKSLKVDLILENIFIKYLKEFGNIYSEECGYIDNGSKYNIYIDPLDGSDNFYSGISYFGTSVALEYENKTICAVICNLAIGIIYIKDENQKSEMIFLNKKNRYFNKGILKPKLAIFERAYANIKVVSKLFDKKIKIRSSGALALSLLYAKDLNFVLFNGLARDVDIKAGLYFCRDFYIFKNKKFLLVAKNKKKFLQIKEIIKEN